MKYLRSFAVLKSFRITAQVAGSLLLVSTQATAGNPRIAASSGHASTGYSSSGVSTYYGQVRATGFTGIRYWFVDFPTNSASGSVTVSSRAYGMVSNGTVYNGNCQSSRICAGTQALESTGLASSFSGYACVIVGDTGATTAVVPLNGSAQTVLNFYNYWNDCMPGIGSVAYDGGF